MFLRKTTAVIMCFVCMLSITGCAAKPKEPNSSSTLPASSYSTVSNPSSVNSLPSLKIGMVGYNTIDDGSFNENIYDGIIKFIETHPESTVTYVQTDTDDADKSVDKVADVISNYDVIVCAGYQFRGITTVAQEHPDKKFILVDEFYAGLTENSSFELPNLYAFKFKEQESGFFAGVSAALETKTNKVSVITGAPFPSNINYQYGFECGVKYVNETMQKNVKIIETGEHYGVINNEQVKGNYIGSFVDENAGKLLAQALISKGVDIIFTAAGGAGKGVFTAAKESQNVKVIGCDVDQFDEGAVGDKNVVLTSCLKVMDKAVEKQLNKIVELTFNGGNDVLAADTASTGYVKEDGRHQLSADTLKLLDEAFNKIKNGEIVPAAYSNGTTPESFTTVKQTS